MLLNNSKIIVIKLGSSTVVDKNGKFKSKWVQTLVADIKKIKRNKNIVIVSSGAIAMGQKVLKINKSRLKVEMSQAIAAVGQISLINEYQKIFKKNNLLISQILVSPDDTVWRVALPEEWRCL